MNNFQKHLERVKKHWPRVVNGEDRLVRRLAEMSALAGLEEQDIAEFCDLLSDEFDKSFQSGIRAANH